MPHRPRRPAQRHRRAAALLGLAALSVVAACSSAPAPDVLSAPRSTPLGTAVVGAQGQPVLDATAPAGSAAPTGPATGPGVPTGAATSSVGPTGRPSASAAVQAGAGTRAPAATVAGGGTTPASGGGTAAAAAGPAPARSTLFTAGEDSIGITPTSLRMCAHAALTYGKAFNTDTDDLNVFWTALNAESNGINGRKVEVTYENDNYSPDTAVQAATTCVSKKIFMLLGGIGFDQIPAVRNYVERSHTLYLHHSATVEGSAGQRYSFSELPTVERLGEGFAQLAASKFRGKRIGIIERDSANWKPGVTAFKAAAARYGLTVVADVAVPASAGNYTGPITTMKNANVDVVWIWLNALESTQVIKQMKAQLYSPNIMAFPFNLTTQTLGDDALGPPLDGVAMYPAYSRGDYSGTFASYADDMKQFEGQYARYRPNADLSGAGGDLLFLNWTAQKALAVQLALCGKDCTRNRFVDVLTGYRGTPTSSACPIDFPGSDGYRGANQVTFMSSYRAPGGAVNWRETRKCVAP
ncbi:MAG: ABC transporter substrate-binding protein [Rhodoferax sp.]|nr:ABC transporter substrate-binding protein [Actinomycetota bacterium]